jgi:hypothetical protein
MPSWSRHHISPRMSAFALGAIPLLSDLSLFVIRWLLAPYFLWKEQRRIPRISGHWIDKCDGYSVTIVRTGDTFISKNADGKFQDHEGEGKFLPDLKIFETIVFRTNRDSKERVKMWGYVVPVNADKILGIIIGTSGGDGLDRDQRELRIYEKDML